VLKTAYFFLIISAFSALEVLLLMRSTNSNWHWHCIHVFKPICYCLLVVSF